MKDDFRYSMSLVLVRDERPKYWEFHCPYCTAKVCELEGTKILAHDMVINSPSIKIRCPGTAKKWCRMWFEITLL